MPSGVLPNGLQMAVNDDGDVAVAWTRTDPDSAVDKKAIIVEASVRPAGGAFFEPEPVSDPPIVEEQERRRANPSVAIDAAGDASVVWRYYDGTDQVIEAAERPAGGQLLDAGSDLRHRRRTPSSPRSRKRRAGEAIAVWEEFEGEAEDSSSVQASSRPDGGEFGAADELSEAGE